MATAKVNILRSVLTPRGWEGPGEQVMDADEARSYAVGYVDILSIDGAIEVKAACCAHTPSEPA